MAGGSEDHSALAAEVLRALGNAVADQPCRVHTSDLRAYVEAQGLAEAMRCARRARASRREELAGAARRSCS